MGNTKQNNRVRKFFAELDAAVAALQRDATAWNLELAERRLWEATLADDLDRERRPRKRRSSGKGKRRGNGAR